MSVTISSFKKTLRARESKLTLSMNKIHQRSGARSQISLTKTILLELVITFKDIRHQQRTLGCRSTQSRVLTPLRDGSIGMRIRARNPLPHFISTWFNTTWDK